MRTWLWTWLAVTSACAIDLIFWDGETRLAGGGAVPSWLPPLATVAVHLSLIWRRRWPLPILAVEATFSLVSLVVPLWQPIAGLLIAVFGLAVYGRPSARRWVWIALLPVLAHGIGEGRRSHLGWVALVEASVLYLAATVGTWLAGRRLAQRTARLSHWHQDLERVRLEVTERERLTLARELHDGAANTITALLVQAAAARALSAGDASALQGIETAARRAMEEIQQVLRLMPREAAYAGGPQLVDLPALIALGRDAGLDLEVRESGTPVDLPPATQTAIYRTIQEGITNTLKYTPRGTRCLVSLEWSATELVVNVLDTPAAGRLGPPELPATSGRGLGGLSSRVSQLGGWSEAGAEGGGYRIATGLPLGATR